MVVNKNAIGSSAAQWFQSKPEQGWFKCKPMLGQMQSNGMPSRVGSWLESRSDKLCQSTIFVIGRIVS
jgi:hypothetical protein